MLRLACSVVVFAQTCLFVLSRYKEERRQQKEANAQRKQKDAKEKPVKRILPRTAIASHASAAATRSIRRLNPLFAQEARERCGGVLRCAAASAKGAEDGDIGRGALGMRWELDESLTADSLRRPSPEQMALLTSQADAVLRTLVPNSDDHSLRDSLRDQLERLIKREWSDAKVYLFGSSANGFGVQSCDVDLCLHVSVRDSNGGEKRKAPKNKERAEKILIATFVRRLARVLQRAAFLNVTPIPHARVPIVKFTDKRSGLPCDLCVNNTLALHNTEMLKDYAAIDPRFRQLVFLIKYWARRRKVSEPARARDANAVTHPARAFRSSCRAGEQPVLRDAQLVRVDPATHPVPPGHVHSPLLAAGAAPPNPHANARTRDPRARDPASTRGSMAEAYPAPHGPNE
jgi:DNA polymerase sigma